METENGKNGRLNIPAWVMQLFGMVIAGLLAYGAARSDIAVLQTRQNEVDRRLQGIEEKIDKLLARP